MVKRGILTPQSWNRLVLDSFILVIIYYSLHRTHRVRGVYPSRLVRLLTRDGEATSIRVYRFSLF